MKNSLYLYILVIALFLIALSPTLFVDGMFLDGLIYASVGRNMAEGQGSIWDLHYTLHQYSQFNEHPPLAFYLQSIFFEVFGDHIWVEKMYSLLSLIGILLLTLRIWRELKLSIKTGWFPLLLFLTCPLAVWSISAHILENTMAVFTLGSLLCVLKSRERLWYSIIAGVLLLMAFLTKGLTGIYILTAPILLYIFLWRKESLSLFSGVKIQALTILSFVLSVGLLFYLVPEAYDAIVRYFEKQLVKSINDVKTVNSRFYIVSKVFTEFIVAAILSCVLWLWAKKKKAVNATKKENKQRIFWAMITIGFSGVVPMMISEKQSGFYIFTTLPIFSIAIAVLVQDYLSAFQKKYLLDRKIVTVVSVIGFTLSIAMNIGFGVFGQRAKDKAKLELVHGMEGVVNEGDVFLVESYLWRDWGLQAYLQRYQKLAITDKIEHEHQYYLSEERVLKGGYQLVWSGEKYHLYKKH